MLLPTDILVVVQARMTSTRLPGKVLLPLGGKPLLLRMVERLQLAQTPFQTVVSITTDPADDVLHDLCRAEGIACFRGHATDLLDRHYRAGLAAGARVVVKIPSDCPLIDPAAIDRVLGLFLSQPGQFDYVSNLHPATWPDGNDVEVMTMAALETAWQRATRPHEREHTTPYFWDTAPHQFRLGNVRWETGLDYAMTHRLTIDYPADYDLIKAVFETLYPQKADFNLTDILNLLDSEPTVFNMNQAYAGVNWYRHHLDELNTVGPDQTRPEATAPGQAQSGPTIDQRI